MVLQCWLADYHRQILEERFLYKNVKFFGPVRPSKVRVNLNVLTALPSKSLIKQSVTANLSTFCTTCAHCSRNCQTILVWEALEQFGIFEQSVNEQKQISADQKFCFVVVFCEFYWIVPDIVFLSLIRESLPRMMQNHMSCLLKQKMGSLVWQHSSTTL